MGDLLRQSCGVDRVCGVVDRLCFQHRGRRGAAARGTLRRAISPVQEHRPTLVQAAARDAPSGSRPGWRGMKRLAERTTVLLIVFLASLSAAQVSLRVSAAADQTSAPHDAQELETFLDPLMADAIRQWHVPGAVILVVQDDAILFSKGYGYANLERQTPVTPDATVFHVFSLSKLFTATAVMQLVEQARVELDADVNTYLTQLRIGNPYSQRITIRHLLTHTAGFDSDQREIGGSARTENEWMPLDRYLAKRALVPIWPPGQQFLYSNAAYDVLGLLVEDVSGRPFAEYMAEHILQPLGMERSSFLQPPPLISELAVTYHYAAGQQTVAPDGLLFNVPAAGLTATATDIAHFMIAQLHNGGHGNARIMQPATAQEMHQQHFTYDPDQPGMAYGFRRALSPRTRNGPREPPPSGAPVLWHEGGGPRATTSYLQLRPEQGFGLLLAFNSDEFRFLDQVLREFNDHFDPEVSVPSQTTPRQTAIGGSDDLTRFAGIYRVTDYSHTTVSKLLLLQADDLPQVVVTGNTVGIRWLPEAPAQPEPLVHVEPLVFTSQDGRFRFTFLGDGRNQITGMVWGNLFVLEKVPWYETIGFHRGLFAVFLLVFLTAAVIWPVSALERRLRKRQDADTVSTGVVAERVVRFAGLLVALNGALNGLFLLGLLLVLPRALDLGLQFGMPPTLVALLAMPLMTTALVVGLVLLQLPVWRSRGCSNRARGGYSVSTVVALAFVPFLLHWNLLGLQW